MALSKQVNIYSLDTSAFYSNYEKGLAYSTSSITREIESLKTKIIMASKKLKSGGDKYRIDRMIGNWSDRIMELSQKRERLKLETKNLLEQSFEINEGGTRELRKECLIPSNVISIFESALTRLLEMNESESIYDTLFVVRTYYFSVLKDLVTQGFVYNGEKYRLLTASAGQIRTKKAVFIKESLYDKYEKTIMCGLGVDGINDKGGMNINKFLAYVALINSATDTWEDFDIDKSIVVDDFETEYNDWVDYIDYEDYTIHRKKMNVMIPHTDGVGIMLDKKTKMVRLPFMKGLMVYSPYDKFIREHKRKGVKYKDCSKVKDIYGKEYDILEDDIKYIFTKSQFKLWKYYDSWEQYKNYFKEYKCEACKCNEEEDEFKKARINYQMLQTLTDITDDEIIKLCEPTQKEITDIATSRESMLESFGIKDGEIVERGSNLQKALSMYPEMLRDAHTKETLKQTKASLVKRAKSGKIRVDGTYTFVSPDTYAFCEWLFLGEENPKGLLDTGEVYCDLFEDGIKLDCLRSPQLSLEHAVRRNKRTKELKKWFPTHCVYTSTRDMISKILQFDCDGDKLLVVADELLINIAERNIKKYDVVPLYYEMKKAKSEMITRESLYDGMIKAYTGGNIGVISNDISKMWNSFTDNEVENKKVLESIKLMCMENNFVIDYAKTLFKPTRPAEIDEQIKKYTQLKLPYFFKYAKDKGDSQIEEINNSTMNRFDSIVKNPKFRWTATNVGEFDYLMLMKNKDIEVNQDVIDRYLELNRVKKKLFKEEKDRRSREYYVDMYIRGEILKVHSNISEVTDMLVKHLFTHNALNKTTLWNSFGSIIVENIRRNLPQNTKQCSVCGDRFEILNANDFSSIYCGACKLEKEREKKRRWKLSQKI